MPEQILIVEDNKNLRGDLWKVIVTSAPRRRVVAVQNEFEAKQRIEETSFDVVITDIKLDEAGGTKTGGLKVLQNVHRKDQTTPVIVVTAYGKMEIPADESFDAETISIEEMTKQMGAFAYVPRPHPAGDYLDIIREKVTQALEHRHFVTLSLPEEVQIAANGYIITELGNALVPALGGERFDKDGVSIWSIDVYHSRDRKLRGKLRVNEATREVTWHPLA